jgi:hypothetical protein
MTQFLVKVLRETQPLRSTIPKLSTDIKRPFNVEGRMGEVYYQGFIEDDTKFNFPFFMKQKSDALDNLKTLLFKTVKSKGIEVTQGHYLSICWCRSTHIRHS